MSVSGANVTALLNCRQECFVTVEAHGNLVLRHLGAAVHAGVEVLKQYGLHGFVRVRGGYGSKNSPAIPC